MMLGKQLTRQYLNLLTTVNFRTFATITPKLIKDLRTVTGSPLKDCMKVLEETQGDIEKAKDLLRKRGLADAAKRQDRDTAEGLVGLNYDKQGGKVTMIEMHCETDFVARTEQFRRGVEAILNSLHNDLNFVIDPTKIKD